LRYWYSSEPELVRGMVRLLWWERRAGPAQGTDVKEASG
jgi:hypothetical protein